MNIVLLIALVTLFWIAYHSTKAVDHILSRR
jgi:hypothetical protein